MRRTIWLGMVLAALVGAWVLTPAVGEDEDRPPRNPRGGAQRGPWGGPGGMGPGMGMGSGASICALDNFLYVVRGVTIYKIDPETLQVVKKATFEEEQRLGPPPLEGEPKQQPPPDEGR